MSAVSTPPRPVRRTRRLPSFVPWAVLAGSVVVGVLLSLLSGELTPTGAILFGAVVYAIAITAISASVEGGRWARDRLATTLVTGAFLIATIPLISLVALVATRGSLRFGWRFLNDDMVGIFGAMTEGGVYHAIIGTVYVTGIAAIVAIPLGILTAVYLVEYAQPGPLKRAITVLVDVMTGIPSIVAGLFAYTVFVIFVGPQYKSALIGGVALALLMTPVVVRSVEEMLRLVPNELREAAYALGVPKWLTIVKVVLRTAIAGITTGIMISIARVIGETAPLLVTVGLVNNVNFDAFDGRIATLPVYVFRQYAQGGVSVDRAWAAALTLIIIVMLLNLVARLVSKFFSPKGVR
ncbi:phosphate ABC transporter permease PstA [Pseudactinotalea suaedae]|uniref:phosphate ABC transporter permease PstA n=1 Tax=Pseudactinotalea suaedae TaxID=1524924 RepID=UPI0012E152E7|nr:phosphate ABC transporter permease PstA [Pseudactinotalea suaedae]